MDARAVTSSPHATWTWLTGQLNGRPVPSVVAIIGLQEGSLLAALDRYAPATRVLALEPEAAAARAFSTGPECQAWRASGRLAYLAGPDYAGADDAWRVFPNTDDEPAVLVDPALSRNPNVTRDDVGRAAHVLKQILFGVKGNREARRKFAPRYLVNAIRNIPAMLAGSDVRALTDTYRGVPAIIVGAGPSLDDAIDELRERRDRALIIATDTALRPLLMSGIAPQLVVGLDPSELNMRHFMALPECRDTWLVSEMALDRRATAVFEDRTFWFRASNHHPAPWLREQDIDIGQIDVWGSVLTAAFQIAVLAGCDPIVAVGADLAFTDGRPYARGTTYEFGWAWSAAQGIDVADSWERQIEANHPIVVPDLHGRETRSTKSLVSFRDWLVAKARSSGRRVVNASTGGIFSGDGVEQARLRDVLGATATVISPSSHAHPFGSELGLAAGAALRQVRAALASKRTVAPIGDWAAFSGGGFDPAAVGRALKEAAEGVDGRRAAPGIASAISWTSVARSAATAGVLRELPEAVTRYRDGADGHGEGQDGPDNRAERVALFADAVRMIDEVTNTIETAGRVERRDYAPTTPMSEAYAWPDPIRWAMLAVEAALGRVGAPGPAVESAFFSAGAAPSKSGRVKTPTFAESLRATLTSELCRRMDEGRRTVTVAARELTPVRMARAFSGCLDPIDIVADGPSQRFLNAAVLLRPRVLTDAHVAPSIVCYETRAGVVCVPPRATESLLVRPDGEADIHCSWPRPISGELPWGDGGAVAWSNGLAMSAPTSGYVMYRERRDSEPVVIDLPVRPTLGWWCGDRVFWLCLPSNDASWYGLVSWMPGEQVTIELDNVTVCGMHESDGAVLLQPAPFKAGVGWERSVQTHAWRWRGAAGVEEVSLGPRGAVSSSAIAGPWTATAYPQADMIRLASLDGSVFEMICHYPFRLAWAGASLVVSTGDRDVLLFENLMERLERLAATGTAGRMDTHGRA
jgi:hypothetical protein